MTEKDKADFMRGLSKPIDELIDIPVDSFLKMKRKHEAIKIIPSREYKSNYDSIRWNGSMTRTLDFFRKTKEEMLEWERG